MGQTLPKFSRYDLLESNKMFGGLTNASDSRWRIAVEKSGNFPAGALPIFDEVDNMKKV